MRTDAKIGFAIGAVLLAVLTVYAIVVPKHPRKTTGTVALVNTPTGPDTPAGNTPLIGTTPESQGSNSQPVEPLKGTPGTPIVDQHSPTPPTLPTGPMAIGPNLEDIHGGGGTAPNLTLPEDRKQIDPVDPGIQRKLAAGKDKKAKQLPFEVPDGTNDKDQLYTIQSGQTLSKIAYEVYGNARFYVAIQRENRGLDPNHLKVGSKIRLPDITPLQPEVTLDANPIRNLGETVVLNEHALPAGDIIPPVRHLTDSNPIAPIGGHNYIVKSGDNLYAISRKVLGTGRRAGEIYDMNKVVIGPDKARLKLGMVLKLPKTSAELVAD